MKSFHQMLRDKGYLRPAREHEQSEGWRQERKDCDWHSGKNPAILPKETKPKTTAKSSKPAKQCTKEGCNAVVYKGSPLCHEHFLERHRERDKIYRDKRRETQKTEKRYCGECGKEIRGKHTALLCSKHYNEYQREQRAKNTAELDALKEAVQSKRTSRLEQKWKKIQEEYENGTR